MYKIGDIVYLIRDVRLEDYNKNNIFKTKFGTNIIVDKFEVKNILNNDTVLIDLGYEYMKLVDYFSLTLNTNKECKIFKSVTDASNYLETILDNTMI